MDKSEIKSSKPTEASSQKLRQCAEIIARLEEERLLVSLPLDNTQQLIHDLMVHQVALELQNEELRRTQQDLETSRARYFDLYDLAPVGYLTLDVNGLILDANLAAAVMLGVARNELFKMQMTKFISHEDQDVYDLHCKQVVYTSDLQTWEMHMIRNDGSPFWASLQAARSENGDFRITLFDITERKQTEDAAKKSENQYRTILHTLLDGFWIVDMQGRFIDVNNTYSEIIGYSRDELLQMSIKDVEALENEIDIENRIQRIIINGSHRFESQHRCKDGHIVDLDICVSNITGSSLLCASLRDITVRKQTENALRQANEDWINTFNSSSDPIFLLDTDHHIMRANKALAAMVGLSAEDIVGRTCHEIIHCSDMPEIPCPQCMVRLDYQSHSAEIFIERLGKYLIVTVSPIFDETNAHVGSVHYSKDITTIKQAEHTLKNAKSDLERKVTERTCELEHAHELMKKVSFELVWAEEKERERIAGELHDQVGQTLLLAKLKLDVLENELSDESMRSCAKSASSLIEESIHDIRSLTFRIRPPILDTAGIETSLEWLCSSISNDYNLRVEFSNDGLPKPLPAEVRYSLYQAVRELLLNVVKHAGTDNAQLSITTENNMFVVNVADNGVGFNCSGGILKHVDVGGYGLYNVKQRIEQLGARFDVESAFGSGTSVTLRVPLTEA